MNKTEFNILMLKKIKEEKEKAKVCLLVKINQGRIKDGFTARNVYINGWKFLNIPMVVKEAVEELREDDYFIVKKSKNWGRKSLIYYFNKEKIS